MLEQYTQHVSRVKDTLPPEREDLMWAAHDNAEQPAELSAEARELQQESLPGAEVPLTGTTPNMPQIAMFSPEPSNLTR